MRSSNIRAATALVIALCAMSPALAGEARFSGFNAGFTGAVASSFDDQVEDPSSPPSTFGAEIDVTSFGAGVFAGYDWQIDRFVLGVVGEGRLMTGRSDTYQWNTIPGNLDPDYPVSAQPLAQLGLRGRVGFVLSNTLYYVTGGLALTQVERGYYDGVAPSRSIHTNWDQGYVIGGGIERPFNDWLAFRVEYQHSQFEQRVVDPSVLGNFCCTQGAELTSQSVQASLVFRLPPAQ